MKQRYHLISTDECGRNDVYGYATQKKAEATKKKLDKEQLKIHGMSDLDDILEELHVNIQDLDLSDDDVLERKSTTLDRMHRYTYRVEPCDMNALCACCYNAGLISWDEMQESAKKEWERTNASF